MRKRKYTKSVKWHAAVAAMTGIPIASRGIAVAKATAAAPRKYKAYLGRRALLNIIAGKTDSTKAYLLKKISDQLKVKEVSQKKFKALARSLGVRIKTLELR